MSFIIDGYNLLNNSAVFPTRAGPGTLERSRRALLAFLAAAIEPEEIERTIVVFDAAEAPPGLPSEVEFRGLKVRYATGYADADALIEELIEADTVPRRLTVVSSDHQIQRAARKRRATAVDSDVWYGEIAARQRLRRTSTAGPRISKPAGPLTEDEIDGWLAEFGDIDLADIQKQLSSSLPPQTEQPTGEDSPKEETRPPRPSYRDDLDPDDIAGLANPFPPGYADDLFDEDS